MCSKLNFRKHSQNKMDTISLKFLLPIYIIFLYTLQFFKINIVIQIKVLEKYFSLFNNVITKIENSEYNHCLSLQCFQCNYIPR